MASDAALPLDYNARTARAGWWNMLSDWSHRKDLIDSGIAKIKKAIPDITDQELEALNIMKGGG